MTIPEEISFMSAAKEILVVRTGPDGKTIRPKVTYIGDLEAGDKSMTVNCSCGEVYQAGLPTLKESKKVTDCPGCGGGIEMERSKK